MNENADKRLDELIDRFHTAMLVTHSLEGQLRARPMAIADHVESGRLYFATRSEDEKLDEIVNSPEVAVTMQDDDRYLSITGCAVLEKDPKLAEQMWKRSMKIWFPEGAHDPRLVLIMVLPKRAEYWDRSGLHKLSFLWEAGKALLSGSKADDQGLSGHAKVGPNRAE